MTNNFTLRLPPDDHKNFKVICTLQGESMTNVIKKLVQDYIREHKAKVA